jgi:hypothetical protein
MALLVVNAFAHLRERKGWREVAGTALEFVQRFA